MNFPAPLLKGILQKRYKRFLADITLETGETITAHCANSGSMLGLKEPGSTVWVTPVPEIIKRKLRYDWQIIEDQENNNQWVGINTSWPNKIVEEALKEKKIKELSAYKTIKREVKYGQQNSRIDFLLTQDGLPDCYLEVKNVTLKVGDALQFPDSVTARGAKHLQELMHMASQGYKAVVLYVVQRQDGAYFQVASSIDPTYGTLSKQASKKGVEFLCYRCAISKSQIELDTPVLIEGSA